MCCSEIGFPEQNKEDKDISLKSLSNYPEALNWNRKYQHELTKTCNLKKYIDTNKSTRIF